MNKKLAVAVVGGAAFLGGAAADLAFRAKNSIAAQGPPLPPVPRSVAVETEKPSAHTLADRFQAVIKQLSPSVVAVDAVKPPSSDPTAKGKVVEESGSGVLVKFRGISGVIVITNSIGSASSASYRCAPPPS
jgi:hypothetical protein